MKCQYCQHDLTLTLIDLGSSPPSNAYLTEVGKRDPEKWFPLRVLVCTHCWLAQTEEFTSRDDLFDKNYAYFSSFSTSWLAHAKFFVEKVADRFCLDEKSHVVEIAANDGYLLQFVKSLGIPCLGVEPTASTATAAREKGINIIEEFFGERLASSLASQGKQADLMIGNNVLAHVPSLNDFLSGFEILLKPKGVAVFEFPHLLKMIENCQFDTIYHEHFCYLSMTALIPIFKNNGLEVFDVEKLSTHGGSLRVFVQKKGDGDFPLSARVLELMEDERVAGLKRESYYQKFQEKADNIKNELLAFLIEQTRRGKKIAAYGAAAKGSTLLNYAGVKADLLPFVVDKNPHKQGMFMPGSRIPILAEESLRIEKPDVIILLPWNLKKEIMGQLDYVRAWGGQFVVAVPSLTVF